MTTLSVRTSTREELVEITSDVERAVAASGVREGICVLWSEHTTAGLTVNEGADPAVARDISAWLEASVPRGARYRHLEGNADSHIKTSLVGPGLTLIISEGRVRLGRWQGVFLCEFDGPRERRVTLRVVPAEG
ncbi:MAG: secondary thiamine-phosphate synthase enzyme YjbQ [Gemmatimonadota bacterium]